MIPLKFLFYQMLMTSNRVYQDEKLEVFSTPFLYVQGVCLCASSCPLPESLVYVL